MCVLEVRCHDLPALEKCDGEVGIATELTRVSKAMVRAGHSYMYAHRQEVS